MGTRAVPASKRVAELLKRRRIELGLTQRDVADELARSGERLPVSTLARIEQGKLDPGTRRLALLARTYDLPEGSVFELVELEAMAGDRPAEHDPKKLLAGIRRQVDEGRFSEALAAVFEILRAADEGRCDARTHQRALVAQMTISRALGKQRIALAIVERLLSMDPGEAERVSALTVASSAWVHLGSPDVAYAMIERAASYAKPGEERRFAWVFQQKAKIEHELGRPEKALETLAHAIRHYETLDDRSDYCRALMLQSNCFRQLGQLAEALRSREEAVAVARTEGHRHLEALARIGVGRIQLAAGNAEQAVPSLLEGLALAVPTDDPNALFHAHYNLWKAFETLGDSPRAELELDNAAHFAGRVEDSSEETREVLKLRPAQGRRRPSVPSAPPVDSGEDTQASPKRIRSSRTA